MFPQEQLRLPRLFAQLAGDGDLCSRKNFEGHVTASALVFTPDFAHALLIHHKTTGLWLQPGGHVDPEDASLWGAAAREVAEETGLTKITPHPWHAENGGIPFDIDTHAIPARPAKGEAAHWHHDALFLAIAPPAATLSLQAEEILGAEWRPVETLLKEPRLERVLKKF